MSHVSQVASHLSQVRFAKFLKNPAGQETSHFFKCK